MNELVYQWDFGDGTTANDVGVPGVLVDTSHIYSTRPDGTPCTAENPCVLIAALTVTDQGGRQDTAELAIAVGDAGFGACCFLDDICFDAVAFDLCKLIGGM